MTTHRQAGTHGTAHNHARAARRSDKGGKPCAQGDIMQADNPLNRAAFAPRRRQHRPRHALLAAVIWLMALSLPCSAWAQNELVDLRVAPLSGDRLEIILELSGPAADPISFTIDNPARIALDLPQTRNRLERRSREIGEGIAQSVHVAEAEGRTRVVVNLTEVVPYATRVEDNMVYVTLNARETDLPAARPQPEARPGDQVARPDPETTERRIRDIDFRRGAEGQGRVVVQLSDPRTRVNITERGGRTVVTLADTRLPGELMRRLDVVDFATPVQTIDARRDGNDTELVISPTGDFERLAYQSDDMLTIEFQEIPPEELERRRLEDPEYTGERITLNFQDVEVRAVLQILSDVAGVNMVVSDSVGGSLALRLQNVPWDQALDIILRSKGLGKREVGDVIFIAPSQEIAARERSELEAQQQIRELAPVRSEYIQVNYARAGDLASLLRSGDSSLLSDRGRVSVDERTNTLLVQDTAEKLGEVRALVTRLDVPVRQVLIESRIVIANSDFTRDIGSRFGVTAVRQHGDDGIISSTSTVEGSDTIIDSFLDPATPGIELPGAPERLNVNLPAGAGGGRMALAILGSNYLVDLELSALQAEGRGEVVSNPRVLTANQRTASIRQGVEIPFQEATAAGATAISFKEATLAMEVTPQITPDDRVIMELTVNKDSIGQVVPTGTGGSVPTIDTQSVTTQVLVDDGETVVLGGIYEQETRESSSKVPVLGDIPIMGRLFRRNQSFNDQAELLIFVTPRIVRDGLALD